MKKPAAMPFRRSFLVALLTFATLLTVSSAAFAFGNFRFKQTRVEEQDEKWKLDMDVDYGSTPHIGHIPFDFVFELKTYYEYSIEDRDKEPLIRPKPQREQQPQRLPLDIDFSDASGKVWQKTRFSVSIRRKDNFEAGEYRLTIRRSSDGAQLGQPITMVFNGRNQLIDRRTMVIPEGGGHRKSAADGGTQDAGEASNTGETEATKEDTAAGAMADQDAGAQVDTPPAIEKRPGAHGCGCEVPAARTSLSAASMALLAGLVVALRARRHTH